jgi:hypothetical protein
MARSTAEVKVRAPVADKFYINKSQHTGVWRLRRGMKLVALYLSWIQAMEGIKVILDAEKKFGGRP